MIPQEKSANKNPSNQFAKLCIAEALIRLLEKEELESISVSDICREAGFSRMAYYRNFTSKQDILSKYMTMLADRFRGEAVERFPSYSTRSYDVILFAFQYFRNYQNFALRLIQANMSSILQNGLNYYFEKYISGNSPGPERKYAMYYYAGALFNLYTKWVQNGTEESPEYMAGIMYDLVRR